MSSFTPSSLPHYEYTADPSTATNGKHHPPAPPAPVGEVIESTTTDFTAQACELDSAPPFGAFVQAAADDGLTVFGVVAQVETSGIDPSARPVRRGHDDVRDGLIYEENPDLPHVLRTTFRILVLGFVEPEGGVRQFLPPRPPRLHYSVNVSSAAEVRAFTDAGLDYLGTLLRADDTPTDELIAANVRLTATLRQEPDQFPRRAGRELAQLLRGDYARFSGILKRMVR
jgi:hypothetical protein